MKVQLSKRIDELHRANEVLRRQVWTAEHNNGELKAKLERISEKFRQFEHDCRGSGRCIGSGDGRRPFQEQQYQYHHHMTTSRATSTVAVKATESEMLRKRKCCDGREPVAFIPINE